MSHISKQLVGIVASTALLSLVSAAGYAQTTIDVLTGTAFSSYQDHPGTSTYKFTGSVILNGIGFVTNGHTPSSLSYKIKGVEYTVTDFSEAILKTESDGFRWLTISPQSMLKDEFVTVSTVFFNDDDGNSFGYLRADVTPNSLSTNVSYLGLSNTQDSYQANWLTNSNLRVSNPSSNVAPEPGSFVLALTGGAALIGICFRRRRNAG